MSSHLGSVPCPECRGILFLLEDWETYVSVICMNDGHKMGELVPDGQGQEPRQPVWRLGPPQPAFREDNEHVTDPNQHLYVPPENRIA